MMASCREALLLPNERRLVNRLQAGNVKKAAISIVLEMAA